MFWKRTAPTTAPEAPATTNVEDVLTATVEALQEEAVKSTNGHAATVEKTVPAGVEAAPEPKQGGGKAFFFGTLVGLGLGAAAALLFAPKSGEETRSELSDKGIELKNTVVGKSGGSTDMSETFKNWSTDTQQAAKDAQSAVVDASASMSEQAKKPASYAESMVNEAKIVVSDAAANASDQASNLASEAKDAAQSTRDDIEKKL
jgi:gas vesicle protein